MRVRVNRQLAVAVATGAIGAVALQASPAAAHTGRSALGLGSGLSHPLLGVDHVFAMVTVGMLAPVLARPLRAPAAFLAAMALGGALGIAGMPLPLGEALIALSVVALGGALVAGRSMRPHLALGLAALAGLAHGHAHGAEVPSAAHPAVYVMGFLAATTALHLSGMGVGLGILHRPRARAAIGATVVGAGVGLVAGVI